MDKEESIHENSKDCWCKPTVIYEDENGVVYLHNDQSKPV